MFKIKKIDKLIAKKFLPSFFVAFSIALFVLIMQVLWIYIDDIVGKGASVFMILEMIFYMSISMVPKALPLGVLVASVMVLGGMGENYELSSMKSAGMSLWRIMRPIMVISFLVSVASFYTSNTFIPLAQLKFQSKMYDIRKQQPVFAIESGIFNNEFKDMTIYVKEKGLDNESIYGVKIYQNENNPKAKISLVTAEQGKMYSVNGGKYMVLELENGTKYDEEAFEEGSKYPFKITKFKSWKTIFDMSQFGMGHTDLKVWRNHYNALNVRELGLQIDSIEMKVASANANYYKDLKGGIGLKEDIEDKANGDVKKKQKIEEKQKQKAKEKKKRRFLTQVDSLIAMDMPFLEKFPQIKQNKIKSKAKALVQNAQSIRKRQSENNKVLRKRKMKFGYAMHDKFAGAIMCLVFLFIGAPFGAIVRKGGFGMPILISILLFMLYYVVQLFFKKTMDTFTVTPFMAVWIPVLIMSVIGLLITIAAMVNIKIALPNFTGMFNKKGK